MFRSFRSLRRAWPLLLVLGALAGASMACITDSDGDGDTDCDDAPTACE
jgi:hypothetical protein